MNMKWLSIKVRFSINGLVYSFVYNKDGIEIVWLSGDTDRPEVIKVIYAGDDIRVARSTIQALAG